MGLATYYISGGNYEGLADHGCIFVQSQVN